MKKTLFLAASMLLCGIVSAQTFVSTEPSNKNVIIEEYTGINCGYCPSGHQIANGIVEDNPGRVWAINIHQGSFAANTYTTQWGNALANQTGLTGYPSGTVNRHVFSGSNTALSRGDWAQATSMMLQQSSPVNVAARGTLDFNTRVLTLEVEAYYTASSAVSTNKLNVAVLQNNILGPQSGGSSNPAQMEGAQYRHMHMLRDLVTGQWGESIDTTSQGTFVSRTYTYTVPASISNEEMVLEDLEVIVFIAEGNQEILSGCKADIQFVGALPKIAGLKMEPTLDGCDITFESSFTLKNLGDSAITAAEFTYTVNNQTNTYNWTGSVDPMEDVVVELPVLDNNFVSETEYNLSVSMTGVNGTPFTSNTLNATSSKSVYDVAGPFEFVLCTDKYGSENSFRLLDSEGNVVFSKGPFGNSNSVVVREYVMDPAQSGCYILEVLDSYGDGINNGYGAGYFLVNDADGTQVFRNNGKFNDVARYFLNVTTNGAGTIGIEEALASNVSLYPNPVVDQLTIECENEISYVQIYDLSGRLVKVVEGNATRISTQELASGVYAVRVVCEDSVFVSKIVKE